MVLAIYQKLLFSSYIQVHAVIKGPHMVATILWRNLLGAQEFTRKSVLTSQSRLHTAGSEHVGPLAKHSISAVDWMESLTFFVPSFSFSLVKKRGCGCFPAQVDPAFQQATDTALNYTL